MASVAYEIFNKVFKDNYQTKRLIIILGVVLLH